MIDLFKALLVSKVPIDFSQEDLGASFKEECWVVYGYKTKSHYFGVLSYQGSGSFASVDFDWRKATNKKVLGFYHTHPSGFTEPSDRDHRTMRAMVRAEGRELLCGILTNKTHKCFLYKRQEDGSIKPFRLTTMQLFGIKFLIGGFDGIYCT